MLSGSCFCSHRRNDHSFLSCCHGSGNFFSSVWIYVSSPHTNLSESAWLQHPHNGVNRESAKSEKKPPFSIGEAVFIWGHILGLCSMENQIWVIISLSWSRKPKCMLKEGAEKSETNVDFSNKTLSWVNWAGSRSPHPWIKQRHPSFNVNPNYRTIFSTQLRSSEENSWVSSLSWSWASGPSWWVVASCPHLFCHGMA